MTRSVCHDKLGSAYQQQAAEKQHKQHTGNTASVKQCCSSHVLCTTRAQDKRRAQKSMCIVACAGIHKQRQHRVHHQAGLEWITRPHCTARQRLPAHLGWLACVAWHSLRATAAYANKTDYSCSMQLYTTAMQYPSHPNAEGIADTNLGMCTTVLATCPRNTHMQSSPPCCSPAET